MRQIHGRRRKVQAGIATKPREDWDFDFLDVLAEAADSINIICTPEIERAAGRLIGRIPPALHPAVYGVDPDDASTAIFDSHRDCHRRAA